MKIQNNGLYPMDKQHPKIWSLMEFVSTEHCKFKEMVNIIKEKLTITLK